MSIQAIGNAAAPSPVQSSSSVAPAQPVSVKPDDGSSAPAVSAQNDVQPSSSQLQAALEKLKKVADASSSDLTFSVDKDSGRTVVRVLDKSTGDLIRQIPNEDVLEIAKSIEKMQGMLIKKEA